MFYARLVSAAWKVRWQNLQVVLRGRLPNVGRKFVAASCPTPSLVVCEVSPFWDCPSSSTFAWGRRSGKARA